MLLFLTPVIYGVFLTPVMYMGKFIYITDSKNCFDYLLIIILFKDFGQRKRGPVAWPPAGYAFFSGLNLVATEKVNT